MGQRRYFVATAGPAPMDVLSSHILMGPKQSLPGQASFRTGVYLHNILYGIELYLYFKTMHALLVRRKARSIHDRIFAVYSTVMFALVTTFVVIMGIFGQEQASVPSLEEQAAISENLASNSYSPTDVSATAVMILQQMTDGLIIYRCRILWDSKRVIIIPTILWLISTVLGILAVWSATVTATNLFSGVAYKFGLTFCTISIFLQTTLTSMICYRLVSHAKKMQDASGTEYAAPYFTVIRLLVESVLPLTLVGIAFLVLYGIGSTAGNALAQVYVLLMCVSPQMLILRVAEGHAWGKESMEPPLSTLRFCSTRVHDENGGLPAPDIQL